MARKRRIDISQEIKDFVSVYSAMSEAFRRNDRANAKGATPPAELIRQDAMRRSGGLGGFGGVQGDPSNPAIPTPMGVGGSPRVASGGGTGSGIAGGHFDPSKAPPFLDEIAKKNGIDPTDFKRMAWIESKFDPNAKNASGASGLFQFMPATAKQYNLSNPFDARANAEAAAQLWNDNKAYLTNHLGREPTGGELYLAHQQGNSGATKLLLHPNAPAADIVGAAAVKQNSGHAGMTAAQFAGMWTNKFSSLQPGNTPTALPSTPTQTAGATGGSTFSGGAPLTGNKTYEEAYRESLKQPGSSTAALPQTAPAGTHYDQYGSNKILIDDKTGAPVGNLKGWAGASDAANAVNSNRLGMNNGQAPDGSAPPAKAGQVTPSSNSMNAVIQQQSNQNTAVTQGVDSSGRPVDQETGLPPTSGGNPPPQQADATIPQGDGDLPDPTHDTLADAYAHDFHFDMGFAQGGLVKTGGVSRQDQTASAKPGLSALPVDKGTRPGGARTAMKATTPGYALGGAVTGAMPEEDQTYTPPEAPPEQPYDEQEPEPAPIQQPPVQQQSFQPPQGQSKSYNNTDFLEGLGQTLDGALGFISENFGMAAHAQPLSQVSTALPSQEQQSPGVMDGLKRLFSGEGAGTQQDMEAVTDAVDPDKSLDQGVRQAAGLNAVYQYYLSRGEFGKAKQAAASLVTHLQGVSAQYGERAVQYLQEGKSAQAVRELEKGYETIPDGHTVHATPNPDGSADITQKNADGHVTQHFRASPQQILAAAVGLKSGTLYYQTLAQAAGMAKQAGKQPEEPSEAFRRWQSGENPQGGVSVAPEGASATQGATPAGGIIPQQAAPQPQAPQPQAPQPQVSALPPPGAAPGVAPQGLTPQGNAPMAGYSPQALPAIPTLDLPPPPAEPPMQLLNQMKPAEAKFVRDNYKTELASWRAQVAEKQKEHAAREQAIRAERAAIITQNGENFRAAQTHLHENWLEQQKLNAPFSIQDKAAIKEKIDGAVEDYTKELGEDVKVDKRGISTAASHLFQNRHNDITADEAVEAAAELGQPQNPALDKAKIGDKGYVTAKLANGTVVKLDESALGALKSYRDKQIKAEAKKAEAEKNAPSAKAARAVGEMGGAITNKMQSLWAEYQERALKNNSDRLINDSVNGQKYEPGALQMGADMDRNFRP